MTDNVGSTFIDGDTTPRFKLILSKQLKLVTLNLMFSVVATLLQ
jgi:hypothetical protein